MPNKKTFYVVNAFAEKVFGGNPAAVFVEADGLTKSTMQAIARQLNLVETVFVFPPKAKSEDFHLRYFTPEKELPVAGHPTIAAAIALLEAKKIVLSQKKEYIIKTAAGNQQLIFKGNSVLMKLPAPKFLSIVKDRQAVARLFSIKEVDLVDDLPVQAVDTGLGHLIVPVKSRETLMNVKRNIEPLKQFCKELGVMEAQVFTFDSSANSDLSTRNICPREGIEDPAAGVGNGALGAYLMQHVFRSTSEISLKAEQGEIANMPSVIHITGKRSDDKIEVSIGGKGRVMVKGEFYLGESK